MFTLQKYFFHCCCPAGVGSLYLDLLQLLLVGGVHLLKSLLQLSVPLQQALAQLGGQLQVCGRDTQSFRVAGPNPLAHFSISHHAAECCKK